MERIEGIRSYVTILKRINMLLENYANKALESTGLTLSQGAIMSQIVNAEMDFVFYKDIEKMMKLSQPVTVGLISRLQDKKYVFTGYDEYDRRTKIVFSTKAGKKAWEESQKVLSRIEEELLDGFSEDDIKQFGHYLIKIKDNLEKMEAKNEKYTL